MCVAIYKPQGCTISQADLKRAWTTNPDGGGFAYRDGIDGQIMLFKGLMSKKDWLHEIKQVGDVEMIIHARIATHGKVNADNTHPFELEGTGGIWVHNGTFTGYPRNKDESDTVMFGKEFLQPLLTKYEDFLDHEVGVKVLDELFGFSKGIIMLPGKPVVLVNKKLFTEDQGVWFSNLHFRPKVYTPQQWKGYQGYTLPRSNHAPYAPYAGTDDYDPLYWGDQERLWADGEQTGFEDIFETPETPLSLQEQALCKQLEEQEKCTVAKPAWYVNGKKVSHKEYIKHWAHPQRNEPIPLPGRVWLNGREVSWNEYRKLTLKIEKEVSVCE